MYISLEFFTFFESNDFAAVHASGVVMVPGKIFTEFQLIFPTYLQAVDYAQSLE
jgi:hypothetical protein